MPVFFAGGKVGKFAAVTHQIPKLTDIRWRNKTPGDKVVLEDICNPFGVSFVSLLASYCFYVFRVSKNDVTGRFQNIVDGNPILSGGFHAHILAVVLRMPSYTPPQISGKGGKPLDLVGCHALLIGSYDKGFVDIHPQKIR